MTDNYKTTQYVCAVLLIVSSIALAFSMAFSVSDVPNGVLLYIAQAFLLAGSIFGLDYYVKRIKYEISNDNATSRHSQQQPP